MRVGRECEIKPIYSLGAPKSPDVRAPIEAGVILARHIATREGGQEVTFGFCWTLLWFLLPFCRRTEERSAGRLEAGSQFKPREPKEEAGGPCAVSDIWAGASSSSPSLHHSCSLRAYAYTVCARPAHRTCTSLITLKASAPY